MSERYEVDTVNCDLKILAPGLDPDKCALEVGSGYYALMIGNPRESPFVIVGSSEDLWAFAQRISALVQCGLPNAKLSADVTGKAHLAVSR